MDAALRQRLNALNRAFYDAHAEAFADTRPRLAAGIQRVLQTVPPGAQVLEVGCGDGKVGRWLARAGHFGSYIGLDFSAAMLARAERYTAALSAENQHASPLRFLLADLTDPDWARALNPGQFDVILAFAVLHHLPGAVLRTNVVRAWAGLLRTGGRIVMSNWQFTREPRLQRLIQPWSALGLPAAPEPNDYLLSWARSGQTGLRYVHLVDLPEIHPLAAQAHLQVAEIFQADGHNGQLTDYVTLTR